LFTCLHGRTTKRQPTGCTDTQPSWCIIQMSFGKRKNKNGLDVCAQFGLLSPNRACSSTPLFIHYATYTYKHALVCIHASSAYNPYNSYSDFVKDWGQHEQTLLLLTQDTYSGAGWSASRLVLTCHRPSVPFIRRSVWALLAHHLFLFPLARKNVCAKSNSESSSRSRTLPRMACSVVPCRETIFTEELNACLSAYICIYMYIFLCDT